MASASPDASTACRRLSSRCSRSSTTVRRLGLRQEGAAIELQGRLHLAFVQQLEHLHEVGLVRLGDVIRKRFDRDHLARTRDRCLQRALVRAVPIERQRELFAPDPLTVCRQYRDQLREPQAERRLTVITPQRSLAQQPNLQLGLVVPEQRLQLQRPRARHPRGVTNPSPPVPLGSGRCVP